METQLTMLKKKTEEASLQYYFSFKAIILEKNRYFHFKGVFLIGKVFFGN